MEEVTRKLLLDMYGGEQSWCATYGEPLFQSEQSGRTYVSGHRKRELMDLGLLFVVGKRIVTDQPVALFNAIVEMKREDSRVLARATTEAPYAPVEPVKPRSTRVTTLRDDETA
ncbi:hypothetical protein [Paraburkholderia antibiotica]|uniref:Uncharacterized protein n=1 Tax=Paraburkholderia antibiotica TaxID=2728839 RepID=A0A7X9X0W8_9BURK|nr:hypothetical protein [Paraburkholderia antibiotica]NML29398.1 hypothetical protein [Paraburkholderia antibiotica]